MKNLSGKKQFFIFSVFPQIFRNRSRTKTEKLKNCICMENLFLDLSGKTVFIFFSFSIFQLLVFQFFSFSIFQFFGFSVLVPELFWKFALRNQIS